MQQALPQVMQNCFAITFRVLDTVSMLFKFDLSNSLHACLATCCGESSCVDKHAECVNKHLLSIYITAYGYLQAKQACSNILQS